jgi:hypothetical protein
VGVVFTAYIMFSMFAMLNVVTGVFIERVLRHEEEEKEANTQRQVQDLLKKLDIGDADELTWEQFADRLTQKPMQEFFKIIDVDIRSARDLFDILDTDDSGTINVRDFTDGCLRIWAPPKGVDLKNIVREINEVKGLVMARRDEGASVLKRSPSKTSLEAGHAEPARKDRRTGSKRTNGSNPGSRRPSKASTASSGCPADVNAVNEAPAAKDDVYFGSDHPPSDKLPSTGVEVSRIDGGDATLVVDAIEEVRQLYTIESPSVQASLNQQHDGESGTLIANK